MWLLPGILAFKAEPYTFVSGPLAGRGLGMGLLNERMQEPSLQASPPPDHHTDPEKK